MDNKKIVDTNRLLIHDNILEYNDSFIRLENISYVSIEKVALPPLSTPIIFFWIIISIIPFFIVHGSTKRISVLIIEVIIYGILFLINIDRGYYLLLSLNSGEKVFFKNDSYDILKQAKEKLLQCLITHASANITLNYVENDMRKTTEVKDSVVQGSIIGGNNNDLDAKNFSYNYNNNSTISDEDFKVLQESIISCINHVTNSYQRDRLDRLLNAVESKNKSDIRNILKRDSEIIMTGTISSLLGATALEILKRFL